MIKYSVTYRNEFARDVWIGSKTPKKDIRHRAITAFTIQSPSKKKFRPDIMVIGDLHSDYFTVYDEKGFVVE